jgi:hypothetical protein
MMQFLSCLLLVAFTSSLPGVASVRMPQQPREPAAQTGAIVSAGPEGWKRYRECGAEFYLPADFVETPVRGIDSCVGEFHSEHVVLRLDSLGYYTPNASLRDGYRHAPQMVYSETRVDGRRAEIITSYRDDAASRNADLNYAVVLFVPAMSRSGGNFMMSADCKTPTDRETVLNIFRSVRFPPVK